EPVSGARSVQHDRTRRLRPVRRGRARGDPDTRGSTGTRGRRRARCRGVPGDRAVGDGRMSGMAGQSGAAVEVTERDGALWIRLNRPERRNAYDIDMARAVIDALDTATRLHAVVITGSGG